MNALLPAVVLFAIAGSLPLRAQAVPSTPTKFDTRGISDTAKGGGGGVGFTAAKPQTTVRTITHIVLGEPRQWKMSDGKSYIGKLIAFEDIVVVGNAPAPAVPKNPTVVRDGKARLFVNAKAYEVPLQNFGADERKFIEDTRAAVEAKK